MVCWSGQIFIGTHVEDIQKMSELTNYHIQAKIITYKDEQSFRQDWQQKAEANVKQPTFLEGILLKSLHPGSSLYVDYSVFYGGIHEQYGKSSANNQLRKVLHVQNHKYSSDIPAERKVGQGFYDEIQCILKCGVQQLPRTPVSKDSVFILIGFHTSGETETLESRWKIWSGANCVLWMCPKELNLRRVTFLKHTSESDEFTYYCLSECEEGLNYLNLAMDLVETLRLRRCGLVGLYKVERYYIPPKKANTASKSFT